MRYKTLSSLVGRLVAFSLCLAGAHCGDPASGTWVNTMAPMASAAQYGSYMVTVIYGDGMVVSVDLETKRAPSALIYASCNESITGMGTYTEMNNVITSMFQTASTTRMGCSFMADNSMSTTLDMTTTNLLVGLSSGTFVNANNMLTLTATSGTKTVYNKQQ